MKRTVVASISLLCAILLLNGCAFRRLKKDLTAIERLQLISGVVVNESADPKPVVVVLWALDKEEAAVNDYWVVGDDGAFSFHRESGRYYLLAFEDVNEDSCYQPDEPLAAYGETSVLDLDSGESYENLTLRLLPAGQIKVPGIDELSIEEKAAKFVWRDGQTGIVTSLDNPDFSQENASLGLWQPRTFYEKFGMKLYFLEPYNPEKIPVLLIHGSSGYPRIWNEVVAGMDRERFQPWVIFYPSGQRLDTLGEVLSKYVSELHLEHKFDELVVVAHSMGGLVGRSMIQKYAENENRCRIPLYVTIATPWNGHSGAAVGVKYTRTVVPAWYDMVPDSPFIEELFACPLPPETDHHLFFAYRGKGGVQVGSGNTDGTVSLASQLFLPAQDVAFKIYGIDEGHVGIVSDTNMLLKLNRLLNEKADIRP